MMQFDKYKDPDGVSVRGFDWENVLEDEGDSIVTSTWSVSPSSLTLGSDSIVGYETKVWLTGGLAGYKYLLTNKIVTTLGRTIPVSAYIVVQEL